MFCLISLLIRRYWPPRRRDTVEAVTIDRRATLTGVRTTPMKFPYTCSRCQARLSTKPAGLCPCCLLRLGLADPRIAAFDEAARNVGRAPGPARLRALNGTSALSRNGAGHHNGGNGAALDKSAGPIPRVLLGDSAATAVAARPSSGAIP